TRFSSHHHSIALMSSLRTLFIQGCCHPRDLPSFPTRRSSDLIFSGNIYLQTVFVHAGFDYHGIVASFQMVIFEQYIFGRVDHNADRKSTRLNSSHVKISYAVFCLKKKNMDPTAELPHICSMRL